jgi:hypothetical protein
MASPNPWTKSRRHREPAQPLKPLVDPAAWHPGDLRGTDAWVYRLSDAEITELFGTVASFEGRGGSLKDATKQDFPLPRLGPALRDIREELMDGRGFALIRGLPVEGRTVAQTAAAFWAIGTHMGRVASQNSQGHLLGHVKDLGGDYSKVRGYTTRAEMRFHCDSADILSLCCLHAAKSGGAHRICSSVTLYNEMLARRPDLAEELTFRFYRARKGAIPPGETEPWVREAMFSFHNGYFAGRGAGGFLKKAQAIPGVPKLTARQQEGIDLFYAIANELALDLDLRQGDITFVMNHVTLHSRTEYEDWPEPERKRHLLRLWLSTDGYRPVNADIERALRGVQADDRALKVPMEA